MFDCPHCSNPLSDGATFCNRCWQAVDGAAGATTAATGVPPVGPVPGDEPPPGSPVYAQPGDPPGVDPGWGAAGGAPSFSAGPPASPFQPPPYQAPPYQTPQYQAPQQQAQQSAWGDGYPVPPAAPVPPGYEYGYDYGYGAQPAPGAGWYGAPPNVGTNGLAIASLVCSLLGFFSCGITTIVGVILGHIALTQIKRSGQQGRGLAIGGLAVGYVSLVMVVLVFLLVLASGPNA